MSRRGPYKCYYDASSDKEVPRSTYYKKNSKNNIQQMTTTATDQLQASCHSDSLNISSDARGFIEIQNFIDDRPRIYDTEHCEDFDETPINNIDDSETLMSNHPYKQKIYFKNKRSEADKRVDALTKTTCDCSNINVAEILLMFMHISKKHSLTWSALLDIFMILNFVFKKSIFPTTKYLLKKLMHVNSDCLTHHVLCDKCDNYLGKQSNVNSSITCTCGYIQKPSTTNKFFIEIDIFQQLRILFSDNTVVNSFRERFIRQKQNNEAYEDVYDGEMYKHYLENANFLKNIWNFSYTFNTDGCQASDNSKVSIWPIYIMINEIPSYLRKNYMILVGLWVAKTEPLMNIFLQPFVKQANHLSTQGFEWINNGLKIESKLFAIGCCVDSVARCSILNMKKFNGIHGCTYCEHPTKNINGVRKYPLLKNVPHKRMDAVIREQMISAHSQKKDNKGVWGPSPLLNLKHFDLVKGMIIDFMHSCLLGVAKLYTDIIMTNAKMEYYVGSPAAIHIINERLLSIKPPTCIGKLPRDIKERNMWKASEWLLWILFYAVPCLHGLLPQKNLNHLALFVTAMNILLNDTISKDMLKLSKKLLIKFVLQFGKIYGDQYMHYNVHLLTHICDTVKHWGPLWALNTFPFENENKELLKMKKNNYKIAIEIVNRLLMYQEIPFLENEDFVSDSTRQFCKEIYFQHSKKIQKSEECYLLGVGKCHNLHQEETDALESFFNSNEISRCLKYERMMYNNFRYTTSSYSKNKKNNDSVFETTNNNFGIIHGIYLIKHTDEEKTYILFRLLKLEPTTFVDDSDVSEIINYKRCTLETNNLHCIHCSSLYRPSIITKSRNVYYLSKLVKGAMGRHVN